MENALILKSSLQVHVSRRARYFLNVLFHRLLKHFFCAKGLMEGDYVVMVSVLLDARGLPCQIGDGEVDDEYTILGVDDVSSFLDMFHYDGDDLDEYKEAMMRDNIDRVIGLEPSYLVKFKDTHNRSPHPLWSTDLYNHIAQGHFYFAMSHTDTLLIAYAGVNLTRPFKKVIRACKEQGFCTYSVTRKTRTRQYAFRCATCFPNDDSMVICEPCAVACHKGHNVFVRTDADGIFQKSFMFCDCGDVLECQCLTQPPIQQPHDAMKKANN